MPEQQEPEVIVLPPLTIDPVFAEMVDDAVAGEPAAASDVDPNRTMGADPHDFAGLYIRHRGSFSLHARRFLRDPRDVDEVVQEAFLRLFLALPELETELQALAYCRRTITNLCIDRYRSDQRRPRLIDLDSVAADDLADDEIDDPVVRAEDAATVRAALSLLSPLHREALVKREIEEKSIPVIAAKLEIPEESVKHVLFRARRALRRILAGTNVAPGADLDSMSTLSLVGTRLAKDGTKLAGFLLLAALFLGTGPDLRVIPVVGSDLPDLPSIAELARPAGRALVDAAAPALRTAPREVPRAPGRRDHAAPAGRLPAPRVAPVPVPAAAPVLVPLPGEVPAAPPAASPAVSASSQPSVVASPAAGSASPSPEPSEEPRASDRPSHEPSGPPESSEPQPSSSPSPSASSSPHASPAPGSSAGASRTRRASRNVARKPVPARPVTPPVVQVVPVMPAVAPIAPAVDSDAWSEDIGWATDDDTGELVMVGFDGALIADGIPYDD